MLKRVCAALALALAAVSLPWGGAALAADGAPAVSCQSYIIMDAESGQVLLEQNADARMYPASITKIMTIALAVQKADGDLDRELTVSDEAVYSLAGTESTHIALQPGEVVNLEDILYATQMMSANDGANVLAEFIGGTIEGGVEAMNEQAEELGLEDTHYTNPHGLMDTQHYTTARDMARITQWALTMEDFETIFCRTDDWIMQPTNMNSSVRYFGCSDWMKVGNVKYREYALGSKSGYHDEAGQTLVTLCEQDGIRLIGVLMKDVSKAQKFADACSLMDYCFANFERVEEEASEEEYTLPVLRDGVSVGEVSLVKQQPFVILHKSNLDAEIRTEDTVPESLTLGEEIEACETLHIEGNGWQSTSDAVFAMSADGLEELAEAEAEPENTEETEETEKGAPPVLKIIGGVLAALVLLLTARVLYVRERRKRRRRRRAAERRDWQVINQRRLPAEKLRTDKKTLYKIGTQKRKTNPRR